MTKSLVDCIDEPQLVIIEKSAIKILKNQKPKNLSVISLEILTNRFYN